MNEKDLEEFNKWYEREIGKILSHHENQIITVSLITLQTWERQAWQAACQYKDKQQINGTRMRQMNDRIEDLIHENKKLREALESIAKDYDRPSDMMKKAREALKEVGER